MANNKKPTEKPSKLGRGLSALMADIDTAVPSAKNVKTKSAPNKQGRGILNVPISKLIRNPDQPRRHFDKELMAQLADSIRDKGVLQPILVRPIPSKNDEYQIVAGERRWQAAQIAGLDALPVLVRTLTDQEVLEVGVVENVQRADLNPIEEALAYRALKEQFGRKQDDIAKATGKSRSHIANVMRLLSLPAQAQKRLINGDITAGHARAILASSDPLALTGAIIAKGMSVRQAENWARAERKPAKPTVIKDADTRALEDQLSEALGLQVTINHQGPRGSLTIKYKTIDQREDFISRLSRL